MRRGRQPLYPQLLLRVVVVVVTEEEAEEGGGRKIEEKAVERDELKEEQAMDRDKVGR